MKWSRIKNIMLWFLIIMNLFMLIFIAVDSYRKTIIPKEVISASMEYLEDSNFSCDRDEFPKSYRYAPTLDVSFYSASDLAEVFFGKQVAFRTSERKLISAGSSMVVSGEVMITVAPPKSLSGRAFR